MEKSVYNIPRSLATTGGQLARWPFSVDPVPISCILAMLRDFTPMQLTSNGGHMVVDFYPVKYADGTISERLMYKTVTFMNSPQSKSYINKVSFEKEVDSRVEGYKYEVTDMHTEPQLFNSALIQTRW